MRHDRMKSAIKGKPGWFANGHREVFCKHGNQATKENFRRKKNGEAVCGVEGNCGHGCGHISITAGEWRRTQNPKRFVKTMPGEEHHIDWRMGNPLTFNDRAPAVPSGRGPSSSSARLGALAGIRSCWAQPLAAPRYPR
jgi:hypothetical protein